MLEEYRRKRDFKKTPEPPAQRSQRGGDLKFVIQKHSARRLHYDFRLEVDGVLVSWAVPKGPSTSPGDKRLAIQTEDHPFDYRNFEGVIPAGEYGGGPVIIWDEGVFAAEKDGKVYWGDPDRGQKILREGLKKGKISIFLKGKKLHGSWTLFRLSNKQKDWILLKHKDEFVDTKRDVTSEDRSVVSGRTIEEMRSGESAAKPILEAANLKGARAAKFPREFNPMLATLTDGPFEESGWIYEPKLDGIRAIGLINAGDVTLESRRGLDLTASYPEIAEELSAYDENIIFDGEIVALDQNGRPSFQALQQRSGLTQAADVKKASASTQVYYYVFDLLYVGKHSLMNVPLEERKELLRQTLIPTDKIRLVDKIPADGFTAYQASMEAGLEGIMAKRVDSIYEPGRRSKSWLKVKGTLSSEFIICGYTEGTGSRATTFGSLILGYYKDGKLYYAGGCGTGFNEKTLQLLYKKFRELKTDKSPFSQKIPGKRIQFIKPVLVAEIKFAEWTKDEILRSPVFMRLRPDKSATDCRRDEVVHEVKEKGRKDMIHKHHDKAQPADVVNLATKRALKESGKLKEPGELQAILDQLAEAKEKTIVEVDGNKLPVTNLSKVFWPGTSHHEPLTKRDYMMYLAKVSPWLLPHMKDRPITFVRFPNGIKGGKFYQKHWEKGLPDFVQTLWLFAEHVATDQEYIVCNNLPTLLWLAQIADLELHTWQSRIEAGPDAWSLPKSFGGSVEKLEASLLNYPDFLLFDLDPYLYSGKEKRGEEPELHMEGFKKTIELAKWVKEILDSMHIESFVKTTGKTGIHMYVPIVREFTFDEVRALSGAIGQIILKKRPNDVTMEWAVVKRTGKVFFDHNMNARGKTLASIYSPRVSPEASVSFPLSWDQIDDVYPTDFTMHNVPELLQKNGDLWADILKHKNDLRQLLSRQPGLQQTKKKRSR